MEQVTIRDIARKCKVGVSTVSRAMNNHPDINPETKEIYMEPYKYFNNFIEMPVVVRYSVVWISD